MITFRRSLAVALAILTLLFLFGGKDKIDPKRIIRDKGLELRLAQVERELSTQLKLFDESSQNMAKEQQEKIHQLEVENKVLEMQIQELRRLPETASIRQQLAYQFPYKPRSRFPAFIWQTWKVDRRSNKLEEHVRSFMDSWDTHAKDFVHEVLSDKAADKIIRHIYMNVPDVVKAWAAMPENILKADFFRYLILLARGGTYSDADTEALKPVPIWIPTEINPLHVGLTIGIEADPDRPDWNQWYARRIQFCQWTIQAKPGHPVLREVVAHITEHTLKKLASGNMWDSDKERGTDIMNWTGPGVWTDVIFNYFNSPELGFGTTDWHNFTGLTEPVLAGDVLVLPITSFSPGVDTMGSKPESDPLAFVKHHFEGSWK